MVHSAKPEPCPFCGAHLVDITVCQTKPRWRHPSEVCPLKDWIITDVPVWNNRAATISDEETRNIIEGLERHAGGLPAAAEKSLMFRAAHKLKKMHTQLAGAGK